MANKKNFDQLIEAAVNYWAAFFGEPAYGDKANGGQLDGLASMFLTRVKMELNEDLQSSGRIEAFKDLLTKYLSKFKNSSCTLYTDWAPEWPLSEMLRNCEIPNTYFPSKTIMWVNLKEAYVKVKGSNDEEVQIYPVVKTEKVA